MLNSPEGLCKHQSGRFLGSNFRDSNSVALSLGQESLVFSSSASGGKLHLSKVGTLQDKWGQAAAFPGTLSPCYTTRFLAVGMQRTSPQGQRDPGLLGPPNRA